MRGPGDEPPCTLGVFYLSHNFFTSNIIRVIITNKFSINPVCRNSLKPTIVISVNWYYTLQRKRGARE